MVEQLFGSKTRVKLLQLFMSNPNRSFYVREITRKVEEQINSVRRELSNLLSIGVITSDDQSNRLYYEVNQKYQYYEALSMMFGGGGASAKKKPTAAQAESGNSLEGSIRTLGNVQLAVLTGQFTRDEAPGVDIVIVGDINKTKLDNFIAKLEQTEKKELRYAVFSESDFAYRRQIKDRFAVTLMESKIQVVVDRDGLLNEQAGEEQQQQ